MFVLYISLISAVQNNNNTEMNLIKNIVTVCPEVLPSIIESIKKITNEQGQIFQCLYAGLYESLKNVNDINIPEKKDLLSQVLSQNNIITEQIHLIVAQYVNLNFMDIKSTLESLDKELFLELLYRIILFCYIKNNNKLHLLEYNNKWILHELITIDPIIAYQMYPIMLHFTLQHAISRLIKLVIKNDKFRVDILEKIRQQDQNNSYLGVFNITNKLEFLQLLKDISFQPQEQQKQQKQQKKTIQDNDIKIFIDQIIFYYYIISIKQTEDQLTPLLTPLLPNLSIEIKEPRFIIPIQQFMHKLYQDPSQEQIKWTGPLFTNASFTYNDIIGTFEQILLSFDRFLMTQDILIDATNYFEFLLIALKAIFNAAKFEDYNDLNYSIDSLNNAAFYEIPNLNIIKLIFLQTIYPSTQIPNKPLLTTFITRFKDLIINQMEKIAGPSSLFLLLGVIFFASGGTTLDFLRLMTHGEFLKIEYQISKINDQILEKRKSQLKPFIYDLNQFVAKPIIYYRFIEEFINCFNQHKDTLVGVFNIIIQNPLIDIQMIKELKKITEEKNNMGTLGLIVDPLQYLKYCTYFLASRDNDAQLAKFLLMYVELQESKIILKRLQDFGHTSGVTVEIQELLRDKISVLQMHLTLFQIHILDQNNIKNFENLTNLRRNIDMMKTSLIWQEEMLQNIFVVGDFILFTSWNQHEHIYHNTLYNQTAFYYIKNKECFVYQFGQQLQQINISTTELFTDILKIQNKNLNFAPLLYILFNHKNQANIFSMINLLSSNTNSQLNNNYHRAYYISKQMRIERSKVNFFSECLSYKDSQLFLDKEIIQDAEMKTQAFGNAIKHTIQEAIQQIKDTIELFQQRVSKNIEAPLWLIVSLINSYIGEQLRQMSENINKINNNLTSINLKLAPLFAILGDVTKIPKSQTTRNYFSNLPSFFSILLQDEQTKFIDVHVTETFQLLLTIMQTINISPRLSILWFCTMAYLSMCKNVPKKSIMLFLLMSFKNNNIVEFLHPDLIKKKKATIKEIYEQITPGLKVFDTNHDDSKQNHDSLMTDNFPTLVRLMQLLFIYGLKNTKNTHKTKINYQINQIMESFIEANNELKTYDHLVAQHIGPNITYANLYFSQIEMNVYIYHCFNQFLSCIIQIFEETNCFKYDNQQAIQKKQLSVNYLLYHTIILWQQHYKSNEQHNMEDIYQSWIQKCQNNLNNDDVISLIDCSIIRNLSNAHNHVITEQQLATDIIQEQQLLYNNLNITLSTLMRQWKDQFVPDKKTNMFTIREIFLTKESLDFHVLQLHAILNIVYHLIDIEFLNNISKDEVIKEYNVYSTIYLFQHILSERMELIYQENDLQYRLYAIINENFLCNILQFMFPNNNNIISLFNILGTDALFLLEFSNSFLKLTINNRIIIINDNQIDSTIQAENCLFKITKALYLAYFMNIFMQQIKFRPQIQRQNIEQIQKLLLFQIGQYIKNSNMSLHIEKVNYLSHPCYGNTPYISSALGLIPKPDKFELPILLYVNLKNEIDSYFKKHNRFIKESAIDIKNLGINDLSQKSLEYINNEKEFKKLISKQGINDKINALLNIETEKVTFFFQLFLESKNYLANKDFLDTNNNKKEMQLFFNWYLKNLQKSLLTKYNQEELLFYQKYNTFMIKKDKEKKNNINNFVLISKEDKTFLKDNISNILQQMFLTYLQTHNYHSFYNIFNILARLNIKGLNVSAIRQITGQHINIELSKLKSPPYYLLTLDIFFQIQMSCEECIILHAWYHFMFKIYFFLNALVTEYKKFTKQSPSNNNFLKYNRILQLILNYHSPQHTYNNMFLNKILPQIFKKKINQSNLEKSDAFTYESFMQQLKQLNQKKINIELVDISTIINYCTQITVGHLNNYQMNFIYLSFCIFGQMINFTEGNFSFHEPLIQEIMYQIDPSIKNNQLPFVKQINIFLQNILFQNDENNNNYNKISQLVYSINNTSVEQQQEQQTDIWSQNPDTSMIMSVPKHKKEQQRNFKQLFEIINGALMNKSSNTNQIFPNPSVKTIQHNIPANQDKNKNVANQSNEQNLPILIKHDSSFDYQEKGLWIFYLLITIISLYICFNIFPKQSKSKFIASDNSNDWSNEIDPNILLASQ